MWGAACRSLQLLDRSPCGRGFGFCTRVAAVHLRPANLVLRRREVAHSAKATSKPAASTGRRTVGCTARGRLPRLAHRHCVVWPPRTNVWQIETKPAPKASSLHTGGTSSTHQHCCLVKYGKKEKAMWIKSSLIALGFAGAMVASTPAPAPAQGVHVGPGGVSVDVGRPRYRERYRGYHDYAYDRRYGRCRTVTIERAGSTRTIRRCD